MALEIDDEFVARVAIWPLHEELFSEMEDWLIANATEHFAYSYGEMHFCSSEDAIMFRLRFNV